LKAFQRKCLKIQLNFVFKPEKVVRVDWRHEAACRDEDPELFFPIGNTGPALLQIEDAKAVCRRCAVIEPCLKWALESGQDSGVWGGTSEDERRAIKRRAQRARARGLEPAPHVFDSSIPKT
jgi:WhiB family redox-sensing transcriptional regulator